MTAPPMPSSPASGFPRPMSIVSLHEFNIEIMRRTGNARVVRADEHFQQQPDLILAFVDDPRHESLKILLDVGVVLAGRDADIGARAFALGVERVTVEENSARGF